MPSKAKSKSSPAAKKPAPKKSAPARKPAAARSAPRSAKPAPKSKAKAVVKKKTESPGGGSVRRNRGKETVKPGTAPRMAGRPMVIEKWTPPPEISRSVFNKKQRTRLLELKDSLMDSVSGMASEQLRSRAEGSEASAFGMHQADAGSDAYDRDFALSLLSKEQDALYEIEEALKRLDNGTYGTCEMCGKPIPQARLEALPFARFTIDCQGEYEREVVSGNGRRPVRSLFGLMGDEDEEEEGEEKETVDKSEE
jgi:DnaK suppressor protein